MDFQKLAQLSQDIRSLEHNSKIQMENRSLFLIINFNNKKYFQELHKHLQIFLDLKKSHRVLIKFSMMPKIKEYSID